MKHYIGLCLVLLTLAAIGFLALHRCTLAADHMIGSVRDAFTSVLKVQPQVTVNQRVVLTQTAPIAELAVVTKEELITLGTNEHYEVMSFQIPLTQKKLTAEATYKIKAGFDLHEPFSVEVHPSNHELTAKMSHAKILSVEQMGDFTFQGEDGMLNRISDEERTRLLNKLHDAAKAAAEASTLKSEAEIQVETRLKDLLERNGQVLQVDWSDKSLSAQHR